MEKILVIITLFTTCLSHKLNLPNEKMAIIFDIQAINKVHYLTKILKITQLFS
jgi:hypothetical protein